MKAFMFILFSVFFTNAAYGDWMIDFSRRQKDLMDLERQQQIYKEEKKSVLDMVTDRQEPMQDIVIIHTEEGYHPERIQVKRGRRYRVHVVNVNKSQKNVSFMLDAFSQHHGTYFGDQVVFEIEPRKEGLFDFQCPETQAKGQLVVYASEAPLESPLETIKLRRPASE
jgi:plastocyanin domain-containing protein